MFDLCNNSSIFRLAYQCLKISGSFLSLELKEKLYLGNKFFKELSVVYVLREVNKCFHFVFNLGFYYWWIKVIVMSLTIIGVMPLLSLIFVI